MPITKTKHENSSNQLYIELFKSKNFNAKPFLKWAGGKSQLLSKFQDLYPNQLKTNEIKHFYEPFLGSGAVFFDVVQKYNIQSAYLYDINDELIITYKVIQKDVETLIDILLNIQINYLKLDKEKRKDFFYLQREKYNQNRLIFDYNNYSENWFYRAAQLIFLNKTCFNGLYRVNSKGEFNSPAGDYDSPTICDKENLLSVSKVLSIAEIKKSDFTNISNDLKSNSFVYFDPPYRPISKTANFKSYSKHDFSDDEQIKLSNKFKELDYLGAKIMLSNSDPKNNDPNDNFFDDLYKKFNIQRIPAKRMINSDASKRGKINEIIVTNY